MSQAGRGDTWGGGEEVVHACVHVYVYVYVYVCVCVCMCACVHVHVCMCMCACVHVHVHVCMCACVHVCMCACAVRVRGGDLHAQRLLSHKDAALAHRAARRGVRPEKGDHRRRHRPTVGVGEDGCLAAQDRRHLHGQRQWQWRLEAGTKAVRQQAPRCRRRSLQGAAAAASLGHRGGEGSPPPGARAS